MDARDIANLLIKANFDELKNGVNSKKDFKLFIDGVGSIYFCFIRSVWAIDFLKKTDGGDILKKILVFKTTELDELVGYLRVIKLKK